MVDTDSITLEHRRFSIRIPRSFWIGLATVVVATLAAGHYWQNLRTGPLIEHERSGVKYFLDYQRGVTYAKLYNKPVFVYFTGVNCVNSRRMEKSVLSAPAVIERLRQFICVESFVDSVPVVTDRTEAARLLAQNVRLQEDYFGNVTLPAFMVVQPDFDLANDIGRRKPIAEAIGLIEDEEAFVRFLDGALENRTR